MGTAAANGEGLVDEPLELSSADLDDPPGRTQRVAALCCTGNRRRELGDVADIPGEIPGGTPRVVGALGMDPPERRAHAASGGHEVAVRAFDSAANTQPERPDHLRNLEDYANNAWHRIRLRAE